MHCVCSCAFHEDAVRRHASYLMKAKVIARQWRLCGHMQKRPAECYPRALSVGPLGISFLPRCSVLLVAPTCALEKHRIQAFTRREVLPGPCPSPMLRHVPPPWLDPLPLVQCMHNSLATPLHIGVADPYHWSSTAHAETGQGSRNVTR